MDSLTITAPTPLNKFNGDIVIHPDNADVLAGSGHEQILTPEQLKHANSALKHLNQRLKPIDKLLAKQSKLREQYTDLRLEYKYLKDEWEHSEGEYRASLAEQGRAVFDQLNNMRGKLLELDQKLKPHRTDIKRRRYYQKRLNEHEIALQDEKFNRKLRLQMDREANYLAEIIIRTWNRLGFCYERTVSNWRGEQKRLRESVQFERVIATEDTLQFKIAVSRMAFLSGTVNVMPTGVRVANLVAEETLLELSAACEREITSPHHDESTSYLNGAWIVVHRLGLTDGLLNFVTLAQLMSRYPNDESHRLPLPMGVKRGRKINWVYLTTHPHLLIAGQTGAGKTNAMHAILASLISNHSPDDIRLVLVDLKEGVALRKYQGLPHTNQVITEVDNMLETLLQLEQLRRDRMYHIRGIAEDIDQYNKIVPRERKMPRVLVIIDEYGAVNAFPDQAKQIHTIMAQLAMKARAAGIHLLIGAQTPYNDTVPNKVKSNITFVLVGRQRTIGSSISTLGSKAASELPKIPGRMLVDDGSDLFPVQLPYVSMDYLGDVIQDAMSYPAPAPLELTPLEQTETGDVLAPALFGETQFIDIVLNEFDGAVSAIKVFKHIDGLATADECRAIAKEISTYNSIDHNGETYEVLPYGKGVRLQKNEKTNIPVSDSHSFDILSSVVATNGNNQPESEKELAL